MIQAVELESTVEMKDKEIVYLKRVLESVYSRFQAATAESTAATTAIAAPETTTDHDVMATRTIQALNKRDAEIEALKAELAAARLEAAAQIRMPKAFARRAPPAPPPPSTSSKPSNAAPPTSSAKCASPSSRKVVIRLFSS